MLHLSTLYANALESHQNIIDRNQLSQLFLP